VLKLPITMDGMDSNIESVVLIVARCAWPHGMSASLARCWSNLVLSDESEADASHGGADHDLHVVDDERALTDSDFLPFSNPHR
jgi:hypothetical protein